MPKIRRWFPVSHDINRDPEMRDARKQFGDWIALGWLECLSIADRNNGVVPGTIDQIAERLSSISLRNYLKTAVKPARNFLEFGSKLGWIRVFPTSIEIVNYAEYHRTRGTNKRPSEPSEPSEPSYKETKKEREAASPNGFAEFWLTYPKKVGKGAAEKSWKRIAPTVEVREVIKSAIATQRQGAAWQKNNGEFIPNPATWLNQKRWEDQVQTVSDGRRVVPHTALKEMKNDQRLDSEMGKRLIGELIKQIK